MTQDFKYALRSLSRNPLFALGAIATLALGIGVNSTIFSLANAALFRPMPGDAAPSELVWVSGVWRDRGRSGGMSTSDSSTTKTSRASCSRTFSHLVLRPSVSAVVESRNGFVATLSAAPISRDSA